MQPTSHVASIPGIDEPVEYIWSSPSSPRSIAIICHPHPLYEGTMNNKVVSTLSSTFNTCQIASLRFNFRGVGQSGGIYANGQGETDDTVLIAKWLTQKHPNLPLILSGFSFGGYIALKASLSLDCQSLIVAAPAIDRFNDCPKQVQCPLTLIQGSHDEIIDPKIVNLWYTGLSTSKNQIILPTGHFFHGQLIALKTDLMTSLSQQGYPPHDQD